MSTTHGSTNDEPFFQFDPYEGLNTPGSSPFEDSETMLFNDPSSISDETDLVNRPGAGTMGKGKAVSKPLPIMISPTEVNDYDDFAISTPWSASSSCPDHPDTEYGPPPVASPSSSHSPSFTLGSFSSVWQSSNLDDCTDNSVSYFSQFEGSAIALQSERKGKGKEREDPPSIPPLNLSSAFDDLASVGSPSSLISTAGPSSYGSLTCGVVNSIAESSCSSSAISGGHYEPHSSDSIPKQMPSRRHSFPHPSGHSRRTSPSSMSRIKVKLGSQSKIHSNLARKLLSKKLAVPTVARPIGPQLTTSAKEFQALRFESSFSPEEIKIPFVSEGSSTVPVQVLLKAKGRSNSSPLPLSALDIIPVTSKDAFTSVPIVVRNCFDELLPTELKLKVLLALVGLHESDHNRLASQENWTVMKAASSRNRWVGKDKALRELVKLGRVSKSWHTMVFDGQLWDTLSLRSFPDIPKSLLSHIAAIGGRFTTAIDFAGHVRLGPATLQDITDKLCLPSSSPSANTTPLTQLTSLNLRGCTSLTTRSLHHLLRCSPALQNLCLKGLNTVTNTTCNILAMHCPHIMTLDLSRCPHMDAEGLTQLASVVQKRGEHLLLTELRVSGLRNIDDNLMATLGKVAPFLEVLDLSYARQLHNSAVEAFVMVGEDEDIDNLETVLLTAREAGRDPSDFGLYRKRRTRIRHLSLSFCVMLTDHACSHLAHSVPRLEFLELAGIGEDLKDDGLIRLLSTTPMIRRLDLEDATDIHDSVLAAITPSPSDSSELSEPSLPSTITEPGHALEHLTISQASNITEACLLELIRQCPRLTTLEADSTRMGPQVLREFIILNRTRQTSDAKIVAVDCRAITESVVKDLAPSTRPRKGWRAWDARKLRFLDGRDFVSKEDEEDKYKEAIMKAAWDQDELDEKRVVIKTFYSWQTVDAVWVARDKRRKALGFTRRKANGSSGSTETDSEDIYGAGYNGRGGGGTRWWSPGGRRSRPGSGSNSPPVFPEMNTSDGCTIM